QEPDLLRARFLRRAGRRRRAAGGHRVERVPRAGFREDEAAAQAAGHLRRPQHLRSGAHPGDGIHLLVHRASMSTALVTGGAGYLGSHTVLALAAAGYDVVVFDNLSAGHVEAVDAVARASPGRRVSLVRGDVTDTAAVLAALRDSGASAVLHFAARL